MNLLHLGARAFEEIQGEVVQTVAFCLCKTYIPLFRGTYVRLINENTEKRKEEAFLRKENVYITHQENFIRIPECPITYWVTDTVCDCFENKPLSVYAKAGKGMMPGSQYIRYVWEINVNDIAMEIKSHEESKMSDKKWYYYFKGGEFRRWYGNRDRVINYQHDGENIRHTNGDRNPALYFKDNINWSKVSGRFAGRIGLIGGLYDDAACQCYVLDETNYKSVLGTFNSKVVEVLLSALGESLNFGPGEISKIPFIVSDTFRSKIDALVDDCIMISRTDWDSFETSWDFATHPLVAGGAAASPLPTPPIRLPPTRALTRCGQTRRS